MRDFIRKYQVFTLFGAAAFILSLIVLFRSLSSQSYYEILLSAALLVILLFLGIAGVWKSKKLKLMETFWKPPFPFTADTNEEWLVTGIEKINFLFFRLHLITKGRFYPAGEGSFSVLALAETTVSQGEERGALRFNFPVSGVFHGECYCRLCDIFGFFSFSCGQSRNISVKVRSSPYTGKRLFINAQSGAEDRKNKNSINEERYYMREYTPGDRFRDINWKSSEKIESLVTRISPDNQEKVSRINIFFRNYGNAQKTSLETLWLLDRAKAWLSSFLRNLMAEQPTYIFHVHTAQGNREIKTEDELDDFLEELSALPFSSHNEGMALTDSSISGASELYVFSTACDTYLSSFITACSPRPVSLFMVQPSIKDHVTGENTLILKKRAFLKKGCIPNIHFLKSEKIKPLGIEASKTEILYAETKI